MNLCSWSNLVISFSNTLGLRCAIDASVWLRLPEPGRRSGWGGWVREGERGESELKASAVDRGAMRAPPGSGGLGV